MGEKGLETGLGGAGASAPISYREGNERPVAGGEGFAQAPVTSGDPQADALAAALASLPPPPPPQEGGLAGVIHRAQGQPPQGG
jgi:hypothetical protein